MTFAATNQPGTCLWCGKRIPRSRQFHHGPNADFRTKPSIPVTTGAELFHCDRCATLFGMTFARLGNRLAPAQTPPSDDPSRGS